MDDRTLYWLEIADYDLETARAMLDTGRYLYVGFVCHQVIEKGLKAVITSLGKEPPYIHNLSRLAEMSGLYERMNSEQKDLLDTLDPLNIQARYPDEKDRLASALTADRCEWIFRQTTELYKWIRATL
jgi:HEPN domain-containing protein